MTSQVTRVYADTSVFGGVFDAAFGDASQTFFAEARKGRYQLVTSAIVQEELAPAPVQVREFFADLFPVMEFAGMSEDVLRLREAYLDAQILHQQYVNGTWTSEGIAGG